MLAFSGKNNRIFKGILFGTVCAYSLFAPSQTLANPEGGTVSGGSADISYNGSKLDVYQHTTRAVIDWRKFNIGAGEHTQFHQPSPGSIVVNRVNDTDPSRIDGRLSANGHVVLINPNGIMFGAGSQIDVGSLTATTADISNEDAMAGNMNFSRAGNAGAKIVNAGHITAREAGLVTLVAPQVENSGVIEAKLGKVTLASAETMTLDLAGDGLVKVAVTQDQLPAQLVSNSGSVNADGGRVVMTAAAARDIVDSLIVNTGHIRAKTTQGHKGSVSIAAQGANKTAKQGASKIIHDGTIDVSGTENAHAKGGTVQITADEIELGAASRIEADGKAGGGTVHVGGEYKGGGTLDTALQVTASAGSHISASALESGDGGEVILWADDSTRFNGFIAATGGQTNGDGGFVETSGKMNLGVNGMVDVSSAHGDGGQWLLDPSNVTIIRPGGTNIGGGTTHAPNDGFTINADSIEAALEGGSSVSITTNNGAGSEAGNITVDAMIEWTGSRSLSLYAENDIIVNQAITGREIYFYAGNDIALNANISTNLAGSGSVRFFNRYAGGTIGLGDGAAGDISLSTAELNRIQDGFINNSGIYFGDTNTDAVTMNAYSNWRDGIRVTTSAAGDITVSGDQNFNNNIFLFDAADVALNAKMLLVGGDSAITSDTIVIDDSFTSGATGNRMNFNNKTAAGTMGLGDAAAGGWNLDEAELNRLSGFGYYGFGTQNTNTATLTMTAHNWTGNFSTQSGRYLEVEAAAIDVDGLQTMGGTSIYFSANTLDLTGDLSSTSVFGYDGFSGTIDLGIGDGAAGGVVFDNAYLNRLRGFGFTDFRFGASATRNGNSNLRANSGVIRHIDVRNYDWNTTLSFSTRTNGSVTIGNTIDMNNRALILQSPSVTINGNVDRGSGTVSIATNSLNLSGNLTGTGGLLLLDAASGDLGLGDGASGAIVYSNAQLDTFEGYGFTTMRFGSNGRIVDLRQRDWSVSNITFDVGTLNVNGAQDFGSAPVNLLVRGINLADTITGTGALLITQVGSVTDSIGLGSGTSGQNIHLDDNELGRISDTFSSIRLGGSGNNTSGAGITIARNTAWNFNPIFSTSTGSAQGITVLTAQDFADKNVEFRTNNLALNAAISGTGTLLFDTTTNGNGIGIGTGAGGGLHLDNNELGRIGNGFSTVTFGSVDFRNTMDLRAYTWNNNVNFISTADGFINVNGNQAFGSHDVLFRSGGLTLNNTLSGTGVLSFNSSSNSSIGLGDGASGSMNLDEAELNRINSGFEKLVFGSTTVGDNAMQIRAHTWNNDVEFLTTGSGSINVAGDQNFGAHNALFKTDAMTLNANVSGTGALHFDNTTATTLGIGDGAGGALNFTNSEMGRLQNGFSSVTFGGDLTTTMDLRTNVAWKDDTTLKADTMNINAAQDFGTGDVMLVTDTMSIGDTLGGTGTLSIYGRTAGRAINLGGPAGALSLDDTELSRLGTGGNMFDTVIFGNAADPTADMVVDSWNASGKSYDIELYGNDITFQDTDGSGSVDYAVMMGAGNLLAHAMDSDNTLTPADAGDITLNGKIRREVGGDAKVDLRADQSIQVNTVIAQIDPNSDADGDPLTNPARLDILINSNRDAQLDGGRIQLNAATLISNNGNIALTGGNADDGSNGGTIGDGIADGRSLGLYDTTANSETGIYLNAANTITSGAGNIYMFGEGQQSSPVGNTTGIRHHNGIITSTSGDIIIYAMGGTGPGSSGMGYYMAGSAAQIETDTGSIDLTSVGVQNAQAMLTNGGGIRSTGEGPGVGDVRITVTGPNFEMRGNSFIDAKDADIYITTGTFNSSNFAGMPTIGSADTTGDIHMIADTINIDTNKLDARTSGAIYITPQSPNRSIGLAGGSGNLNLTDNELSLFNAGTKLVIGDSVNGTGDVIIDSWDLSARNYDVEIYGNDITLNDTDATVGVDYAVKRGNGSLLLKGRNHAGDLTADITLNAGISGTSAGSLTLQADNNIVLNNGINNAGSGAAILTAGLDGTGTIDINNAAPITLGGSLALTATGSNITIGNIDIVSTGLTAQQNILFDGLSGGGVTRSLNAGSGLLSLKNVDAGDRNLVLIGNDMTLGGAITNGAGRTLTVRASTAARNINLGGGTGGLDLSDAEIAYLQGGGALTIGRATVGTGTLTVDSAAFNNDVSLYGGQIVLNGMSSPGIIFAQSQGAGNDITLEGVVSSSVTGDAITLVSADDFFNNEGAGALVASHVNGRWLVYSERMSENIRGGLMPTAVEFGVSYPTAPAGAGNRFLYSSNVRPVLNLKVDDASVVYDTPFDISDYGFSIASGLATGDTISNIGLSGDLVYANTYVEGTTTPSSTPYAGMLSATIGTLSSILGYDFGAIQGGDLLVTGQVPLPPAPPVQELPSTYQTLTSTVNAGLSSGSYGTGWGLFGFNEESTPDADNAYSVETPANETPDDESGKGLLALTFSEGYEFSTEGLNLHISPEVRAHYGLPDQAF